MQLLDVIRLMSGEQAGPVRVIGISRDLARRMGGRTSIVWLSRETVLKQQFKHFRLDLRDYAFIPTVLAQGAVVDELRANSLSFIFDGRAFDAPAYKTVVKAARNGDELFLVSHHVIRARAYRRLLHRHVVLRQQTAANAIGRP